MLATHLPSAETFEARERDWRNGPIVYQVFVDRFAPSPNIEAKRSLYPPPGSLHPWTETPKAGHPDPVTGVWTHELAFWGGDLPSVLSRLEYIHRLGADVVYLNPIFLALTNHKYDAIDYGQVDPQYGTRADVLALAHALHADGMRLMLDGVFNHVGRHSPRLQDAVRDPHSPYRDWFFVGPQYPHGYRGWIGSANLAELRLENPAVRRYLWGAPDSIVQGYLRDGVDGWRLDTAYELGPEYLHELTDSAHRAKPGSVVVGEIWNYPEGWFPAIDGIMNFHEGTLIRDMARGTLPAAQAVAMFERMVADTGVEPLLKSWVILDNHDTERLRHMLPDADTRRLAQVLQFTLPGAPVVYYGTELGMDGGGDPEDRAPMRWDLATDANPELTWMKKLIALRKERRALRIGDFRALDSARLFAFMRMTNRVRDTLLIAANPSSDPVRETLQIRDGRIMNGTRFRDLMSNYSVSELSALITVDVPPHTVRILSPDTAAHDGYTPYKRIPGG